MKSQQSIMDGPEIESKGTMLDREPMTTNDFTERILKSKALVIGADMKTSGDIGVWSNLDPNYIGIRDWDNTWMRYNECKLMDWNDEYPEEKYPQGKPKKTFFELVDYVFTGKILTPPNQNGLSDHKFKLIIVDGGTRQYIYDMETLYILAERYMDKENGILIYPVTRNTKQFPPSLLSFIKDKTISFNCYNLESEDTCKYIKHNLDLIGFVNVIRLGLCYVMRHKPDKILTDEAIKYSIIKELIKVKSRTSFFMTLTENFRTIRHNTMNEWLRIKSKFLDILIPPDKIESKDNSIWKKIKANRGTPLEKKEEELLDSNSNLKSAIAGWIFLENNPILSDKQLKKRWKKIKKSTMQTLSSDEKQFIQENPNIEKNIQRSEKIESMLKVLRDKESELDLNDLTNHYLRTDTLQRIKDDMDKIHEENKDLHELNPKDIYNWKIIKQKFIIDEEWEFLRGNSRFPKDLNRQDARSLLRSAYHVRFEDEVTLEEDEDEDDDDDEDEDEDEDDDDDEEVTLKNKEVIRRENKIIEEGINEENAAESRILKNIEKINIYDHLTPFLANAETSDFFKKLMKKYDEQQKQLTQLAIIPDHVSACYMNKPNEDPAGDREQSPNSSQFIEVPDSPAGLNVNVPIRAVSQFSRKSRAKLNRKYIRKSLRKPVRKSIRKSKRKYIRKSLRKPVRKSIRKSVRKSKRKSPRKSVIKSIRKSKRKSVRNPLRKSIRKSKRKSVRKPVRKSIRKSRR